MILTNLHMKNWLARMNANIMMTIHGLEASEMSMTFEEWKESKYGKDYQHGYDNFNGYEVCDGTCDACLWNDYVEYLNENDLINSATEYMNDKNLALDNFHNTVTPDWDEEKIIDWMKETMNDKQIDALKNYFFELYSLAESAWYEVTKRH